MPSVQANAVKDLYRAWRGALNETPAMSLHDMRELFSHWGDLTADPEGLDYVEVDANGVSAMWAIPNNCADDRVVLCTHGGGYVVGSMYSHRKVFGHIAKSIGCKALIVDYRLAPEAPHPAQIEDAMAAYQWLLAEGYRAEHICTTGDSAGGALATSVLLAIRDAQLPAPSCALPMSPWYDPEVSGATIVSNADKDCLVSAEILRGMATAFLGETSPTEQFVNLLCAELAGLPPIYIQVGGDECLLDDTLRFEQRARAAGVDVTVEVYPDMQHVFQLMAGRAPEADDAIKKMAAWAKAKLGLN